jgi:hypothetical protein
MVERALIVIDSQLAKLQTKREPRRTPFITYSRKLASSDVHGYFEAEAHVGSSWGGPLHSNAPQMLFIEVRADESTLALGLTGGSACDLSFDPRPLWYRAQRTEMAGSRDCGS